MRLEASSLTVVSEVSTPLTKVAQAASSSARALGLQAAAGGGERACPAGLEQAAQRVQVGLHLRRQRGAQGGEVEQVDVEVAQVAGELLEALELVAMVLQAVGIDALELALQRARAADGDAQVVQELGVDVLERAGEVVADDLEQALEDDRGGLGGGRVGVELAVELRARARGVAAGGRGGLVDQRDGGLGPAQRRRQDRLDVFQLAVVAAHGGRGHAPVQRRVAEHVRLDDEARDGLLVGVQDGERERARADASRSA